MKNSADQGRPRWITLSETCRILHILRKPNSIIALLFIQNISPFLMEFRRFRSLFFCSPNSQSRPQVFFGQRFNNLQRVALLTSLIQYEEDSFQIWRTAAGYGELCAWF